METNKLFKKRETESFDDYCHRIVQMKDELDVTWTAIANIINDNTGSDWSADKYRKQEKKRLKEESDELPMGTSSKKSSYSPNTSTPFDEDLDEEKLENIYNKDVKTQINAAYRRLSREETLKEMAKIAVKSLGKIELPIYQYEDELEKVGILLLSDWHYGIEIDSYFNKYNPQIAKERLSKVVSKTLYELKKRNIHELYLVNLGDLISGRIHLQLRINTRLDVVTQIMEASELLAQVVVLFAENNINVHYCDTLDNHSRIEPKVKDSLELESLARLTKWHLKTRFTNLDVIDNVYSEDMLTFSVLGHKIIGVHGNLDKPHSVVNNLSMMTQQHYDLVVTAHLHHFSADEQSKTLVISNASLMGMDQYAQNLRLSAMPSQTLIITSEDNVAEEILRIIAE